MKCHNYYDAPTVIRNGASDIRGGGEFKNISSVIFLKVSSFYEFCLLKRHTVTVLHVIYKDP